MNDRNNLTLTSAMLTAEAKLNCFNEANHTYGGNEA